MTEGADISIPEQIPAMSLAGGVLFPHSTVPLFIFESRYRKMLQDVLDENRLFAIASIDESRLKEDTEEEPILPIAVAGLIRSCQKNPDGTSMLLLQGICRVRVEQVVRDEPYRVLQITPLGDTSLQAIEPPKEKLWIEELRELLITRGELGQSVPRELIEFLEKVEELPTAVDIASAAAVRDAVQRLRLVGETDPLARRCRLKSILNQEIQQLKLARKLQGNLDDNQVEWN